MKGVRISPSRLVASFSLLIVVAASWLAVATQSWGQTFLIFSVGGLFLFFPPSGVLPKLLLPLLGLLLLVGLIAFLPAGLLGPDFRRPLLGHGLPLPGTVSPQPWGSLEDLTLLGATLLWAWTCLETKLSLEQREFSLTCYLIAISPVAVGTLLHVHGLDANFPAFLQGLGQFPNRNQTGDILMMGGIFSLARGVSDLSKRKPTGAAWIILTGIFIAALVQNTSRATLSLFGIGVLLLISFRLASRRHNWLTWAALLIVIVAGALIFAVEGAQIQERFYGMLDDSRGGRLPIYEDAVAMVVRDPWYGVGLGNFEGVFNIQRFHGQGQIARCLHPESDWLWIACELGLPGVLIFAFLVGITFQVYLRRSPFPRLTQASMTVAILFVLHSLFDVGGHRMGTAWNCLFLVGLGAFRSPALSDARVSQVALRALGLLFIAVGFLRIQSMGGNPLMPTRASIAHIEESVNGISSPEKQEALLDQAIAWAPLDWLLYYQRGLVRLRNPERLSDSDADFNRALYLEQNSSDLPRAIGAACVHSNVSEALVAWKELLRRAHTESRREDFFEGLAQMRDIDVRTRLELVALAEGNPTLEAISVLYQEPSEFDWVFQNFLTTNPSLAGVNPKYARELFDRWAQTGNANSLIESWPLHPEWHTLAWRAYAQALAKAGRYNDAVSMALPLISPPQLPDLPAGSDLKGATMLYLANPQDLFSGIRLYFAQSAANKQDQALDTLQAIAKLPHPPAYVDYLLAKALFATGQDEAAWHALEPLLAEP